MTVENTLKERGARYGDFTDHAVIAQELQDVMRNTEGWGRLTAVQRQALTVIADKQARILSGDPNYTDNWHDIQGYAKLAEDRCQNFDPRQKAMNFDNDPVMPEIRDGYTHTDGSRECRPVCQHGVVAGGYCGECVSDLRRSTAEAFPAELDPRDGA